MNNPTQQECSQQFYLACKDFISKLDNIDQDTPGQPTTEPTWWVDMMTLRRELQKHANKHTPEFTIHNLEPIKKIRDDILYGSLLDHK